MLYKRMIPVAALALAMALGAGGSASGASVSQTICESDSGTWDKGSKTCTYPVEETSPGNNKGNATWESQQTDTAHGNLKNPKSDSDTTCEGPGNSKSKC